MAVTAVREAPLVVVVMLLEGRVVTAELQVELLVGVLLLQWSPVLQVY